MLRGNKIQHSFRDSLEVVASIYCTARSSGRASGGRHGVASTYDYDMIAGRVLRLSTLPDGAGTGVANTR